MEGCSVLYTSSMMCILLSNVGLAPDVAAQVSCVDDRGDSQDMLACLLYIDTDALLTRRSLCRRKPSLLFVGQADSDCMLSHSWLDVVVQT